MPGYVKIIEKHTIFHENMNICLNFDLFYLMATV